jgi:hypothetical protein
MCTVLLQPGVNPISVNKYNNIKLLQAFFRGWGSGVKRPERDADQSPPTSAEIKNKWRCTSTLPVRLHGMYRKILPLAAMNT